MTGRCYRCGRVRDDVRTRYDLGAFFLCDRCIRFGRPSGLTGTAPKYAGLQRPRAIGRIVAEDIRARDVPLRRTLRDVMQANATFAPPFSDARLQALVAARLKDEGVTLAA